MPTSSLETLEFAHTFVRNSRLQCESLIEDIRPSLKGGSIDLKIINLRGLVEGILLAQNSLKHIRGLIPQEHFARYQGDASKVTPPATHWEMKIRAILKPIIGNHAKNNDRVDTISTNLSKRIRDLAIWECILEQHMDVVSSEIPPTNTSRHAQLAAGDTGDLTEVVKGDWDNTGDDLPLPRDEDPDLGDDLSVIDRDEGQKPGDPESVTG